MAETFPVQIGEYRLVGRLATGGMAEVYRAEPLAGGPPLVLKRLRQQFRDHPGFVARFIGEAKLCVKLRHPNIVQTHKLFRKGPDLFMVQEWIDGVSLHGLLNARRAIGIPLPLPAVLRVMTGLLGALDYVHRSRLGDTAVTVIHRDVTPGNVLIDRAGVAKLTDFGVAEASLHPGPPSEEGALAGTPAYMSPEQIVGGPIDPRSDIFSAGSVLYECLAGRPAFLGAAAYEILLRVKEARVESLDGAIAEPLRTLVGRAMARTPDGRFSSAADFHRALLEAARVLGIIPSGEALAKAVAEALVDEPTQG